MADIRIPRIETLIITVFFLSVGLWGINQCSARRTQMVKKVQEFATNDEEHEAPRPKPELAVPNPKPAPEREKDEPDATEKNEPPKPKLKPGKRPELTNNIRDAKPEPAPRSSATLSENTTLYVTIDGLRMRDKPGLKGELVAKLNLYEPVTFLNEKTDWTQEINLGTEKVTDHWIRVKTQSGKEGWVFGAGLHYFKTKRKGVL